MSSSGSLRVSERIQAALRCPVCQAPLLLTGEQFTCCTDHAFPIVDGVPIVLDERDSIFSVADLVAQRPRTARPLSRFQHALGRVLPDIDRNITSRGNYQRLRRLLRRRGEAPQVLVIGGRLLGSGMEILTADPAIDLLETDVAFGPRTQLICDGHKLPFADCSFDGVIIQGVLAHLLDPYRCVAEIHRVLKAGGLVYAETAFMQQVNAGPFDLTRFTHLGHRRLFRHFREIRSGAVCGTGMALAWAAQYFLYSLVRSKTGRLLARVLARLTLFWLPYLDYLLINQPGTLDGASGYYFLGAKSGQVLADRDLIRQYRGLL